MFFDVPIARTHRPLTARQRIVLEMLLAGGQPAELLPRRPTPGQRAALSGILRCLVLRGLVGQDQHYRWRLTPMGLLAAERICGGSPATNQPTE